LGKTMPDLDTLWLKYLRRFTLVECQASITG